MSKINSVIDYVDPNKENISINQEDLSKYVNLTVRIPSRNYSENQEVNSIKDRNFSLLSGSNFKVGEKEYNLLTDSYVDVSYTEISKNGAKRNRELFGIKSIDVSFDPQFIPQVTMEFTDVRAFTLMGPTEQTYLINSNKMENGENETLTSKDFFNAVFHFPYPKFTLYLKGYYGKSVSFDLAVNDFKSRFNSSTGDFDVTIKFLGYMYGMYTDIPMSFVLASPYFNEKYWKDRVNDGSFVFPSYNTDGNVEKNKDGGIIPTYTEFIEKYAKLVKYKNEENISSSEIKEISKYNLYRNRVNLCDKFLGEYDKLMENMRSIGLESKDQPDDISNEHFLFGYYGKSIISDHSGGIKIKDEYNSLREIENFKPIIEKMDELLGSLFINDKSVEYDNYDKINLFNPQNSNIKKENEKVFFFKQKPISNAVEGFDYNCNEDYKEIIQNEYGVIIKNGYIQSCGDNERWIRNAKNSISIAKTQRKENYGGIGRDRITVTTEYHIYTWKKIESLKNRIESFKKENQKRCEDIIDSVDKEVLTLSIKEMGFSPTIENVYRMIYAHLDTFVNSVYTAVKQINESNRQVRELNDTKYHVDYKRNSNGSNRVDVPAFPLVAEVRNNKREIIYPGTIVGFSERPEIKLVNTIFEKTKSLSIESDKKNKELKDILNETPSGAYGLPYCNFIPLLMTDILLNNGINPYTNVFKRVEKDSQNIEDKVIEIYKLLALRIATYSHYYREIKGWNTNKEDIGKIEAFNFWKAFPDIDNETINYIINDTVKYDQIMNTYVYNKNSNKTVFFSDSGDIKENEKGKIDKKGNNIDGDVSYLPLLCNDFYVKEEIIRNDDNNDNLILNRDKLNLIYKQTKVSQLKRGINEQYNNNLNNILLIKPYDINTFNVLSRTIESEYFRGARIYDSDEQENIFYNYKTVNINTSPIYSDIIDSDKWTKTLKGIMEYENFSIEEKAVCLLLLKNENEKGVFDIKFNDKYYDSNESFIFKEYTLALLKKGAIAWLDYKKINDKNFESDFNRRFKILISKYECKFNFEDIKSASLEDFFTLEMRDNLIEFFLSWVKNGGEDSKYFSLFRTRKEICFGKIREVICGNDINYTKRILNRVCKDEVLIGLTKKAFQNDCIIDDAVFNSFKKHIHYLYKENLTKQNESSEDNSGVNDKNIEIKKSIYYTLKTVYDKWLCSNIEEIFQLQIPYEDKRTKENNERFNEYKRLIYIDSYNNDISNEMIVDIGSLYNVLTDSLNAPESSSLFSVMNEIAQKQKCQFLTLPIYNNGDIYEMFQPYNIYDNTHKLNETGATFVVLYPGETSHILNLDDEQGDFVNDGFDIANYRGVITDDAKNVFRGNTFNRCAFGVTYGMQNQNYFKDIKVSMDDPSVTDYSIANTLNLAKSAKDGDTNTAIFLSNSLYPIFANRAYNCTIEMMGCACITPLMYFQLNNIPMFRGAYIITNVSHKITPDDFTTTFTGTRIPKFNYDVNRKVFDTNTLLDRLNIHTKADDLELDNKVEKTKNEVDETISKSKGKKINDDLKDNLVLVDNEKNINDIISIVDDNGYPIVTFAKYPKNNKSFNDCNPTLKKLLYDIAVYIRDNEEYNNLSIMIISGYRMGYSKSQHNKGEAMDLQAIKRTDAKSNNPNKVKNLNKDLFSILCRFTERGMIDQLIWELHDIGADSRTSDPNTLHVSCLELSIHNRKLLSFGRIDNLEKFTSIKDQTKQHPLFLTEVENVKKYKA